MVFRDEGGAVILNLVCDTSGSMSEGGKGLIARGVLGATEQYVRLGYGRADLRLVAWGEEMRHLEWLPSAEIPLEVLDCKGTADMAALVRHSESRPKEAILLISDGAWSRDGLRAFKRWRKGLSWDALRIIKVGADADPVLRGPEVFVPEDLFAALDGWGEGAGT